MPGPSATVPGLNEPRGRIDFLEGLRGIAVVLVVLYHAHVPGIHGAGWIGVNTFFVVSGFIITALLVREHARHGRIAFRNFFLRRFLRLIPALLLMLGVMALAIRLAMSKGWAKLFLGEAWYAALQIHNWGGILFPLPSQFLSHAWSLSIEWQFYLAWPFVLAGLLALGRRAALWGVAGLILATLAWGAWLAWQGGGFARVYAGTDVRVGAILAGCLVALLPAPDGPARTRLPAGIAALALTVLAADVVLWDSAAVTASPALYLGLHFPFATAAAALLVWSMLRIGSGPLHRLLTWPPLVWTGSISYGLYLWHWPLFCLLTLALGHGERPAGAMGILLALGIPLAFAVSWLSWLLVERPCQKLRHRFS